MENMVQDHEKRIIALEQNYSEVKKEMNAVQASQSKIENMLYSQNTEQKQLIEGHQKEQKDLLNTLLSHTLGIKKNNNLKKWEILGTVIGGVVSGGGILYLIIEVVFK